MKDRLQVLPDELVAILDSAGNAEANRSMEQIIALLKRLASEQPDKFSVTLSDLSAEATVTIATIISLGDGTKMTLTSKLEGVDETKPSNIRVYDGTSVRSGNALYRLDILPGPDGLRRFVDRYAQTKLPVGVVLARLQASRKIELPEKPFHNHFTTTLKEYTERIKR